MSKFAEQEIKQTEYPQVYGIQQPTLTDSAEGKVLSGLIYGHPLFKDGEKIHISSTTFKRWIVGEDEYFETAEGITYRTF